jgi:hypothetical protein
VDDDFDRCDHDENYVPVVEEAASSSQANGACTHQVEEDQNMNQFRDWIGDGCLVGRSFDDL